MAAGGAVSWCLRAQVQKHGSCQFQVGTEGKIVRGELSRGCLAGCCSRDSMCGLVVLSWQVGNDYGRRLSGSRSKVLSGDLSSHSVSSGRSLSILQDKVRRTRECRGIMWLSGKSSKSMLRKSFEPQSKRTPIPWTSWRMEQLVRGFSKKEEERRRIVHSVNFLGKRRSAFEPKNLINCSRLSTDHRCRVSLIIPKEQSPQSLLQHAQQESSAPWSRKTVAKLQSFSPQVSQEHQILGASTEDFSPVRLTTSKTAGHIVRSRAWTAWKQVLSSTSFNFRDNEVPSTPHKGVIPAEQNSCTFTWHCGPPVPAEFKLGDLRESSSEDIRSSKMRASRGTMKQVSLNHLLRTGFAVFGSSESISSRVCLSKLCVVIFQDKDGLKLAKDAENQEVVVDRSESKLSPRELAVGALIQALSPRLDPKKYGQGELALRMADFVCALKASVQTNEIKHCERHAQAAIAAMIDGAHLAQLDVDIFQLWLDVTEIQLMTAPREADVVQLQVHMACVVIPVCLHLGCMFRLLSPMVTCTSLARSRY